MRRRISCDGFGILELVTVLPALGLYLLVAAPQLDAARLLGALRQRIDPVFLPRPLLFVARLPRNATGKLPQEVLRSLAAAQARSATTA